MLTLKKSHPKKTFIYPINNICKTVHDCIHACIPLHKCTQTFLDNTKCSTHEWAVTSFTQLDSKCAAASHVSRVCRDIKWYTWENFYEMVSGKEDRWPKSTFAASALTRSPRSYLTSDFRSSISSLRSSISSFATNSAVLVSTSCSSNVMLNAERSSANFLKVSASALAAANAFCSAATSVLSLSVAPVTHSIRPRQWVRQKWCGPCFLGMIRAESLQGTGIRHCKQQNNTKQQR